MITVCLICLRSDRKLSSLDFSFNLENFYDELCKYGVLLCFERHLKPMVHATQPFSFNFYVFSQGQRDKHPAYCRDDRLTIFLPQIRINVKKFCYECIYKLKKCYAFKKSCQLAAEKLKTWRKQPKAVKKPTCLLYKEMPIQLSFCNNNNYKVYFYQTTDVKFPTAIQMSSSNYPHIVTVNIPRDTNIRKLECEIENINEHTDKALNTLLDINDDVKTEVMDVADNANQTIEDAENMLLDINNQVKTEVMDVADNASQKIEELEIFDVKIQHDTDPLVENLQDEELESADDTSGFENILLFDRMDDTESDSDESIKELKNFIKTHRKPKKTLLEMLDIKLNDTDLESEHEIVNDSIETIKPKSKRKKRIIEDSAIEHEIVSDSNKTMKPRKKRAIDLKLLKGKLVEKFDQYGPIKDTNEKIIDLDVILNNVHKIQWHRLTIQKICSGSGPLEKHVIAKLSRLQDNVTLYAAVFDTLLIEDPEQMQAQFEKRREYACYTKHKHRCESCIISFPHRTMLEYHMKKSHDPEAPLECTLCHMKFRYWRRFRIHKLSHRIEYKCKMCDFVTSSRNSMIGHYNKHIGILYKCKYCENSFKTQATLFNHIRVHQDRKHICQLCASAFNTPAGLKVHDNWKHNKEKFVESEHNTLCEECNITFVSDEIYRKHLRITHHRHKDGQHQDRQQTLTKRRPEIKRQKIKTYLCHLCEWKGRYLSMKQDHYKTQHPNADIGGGGHILCQECGKQFKLLSVYKQHQSIHIQSGKVRRHACTECPKSFFTKQVLRRHTLRHFPPTYECPVCSKKFHTNTGLYTHNKIHENNRRFVCDICGKGFLHSQSLTAHVAGVHQQIRRKRKPR